MPRLDGHFVENLGQLRDPSILLYAVGDGISVGFGPGKVSYWLRGSGGGAPAFVVRFEGCAGVAPEGRAPLGHVGNFLLGADESRWRAGARGYAGVVYEGLYEGIDLAYSLDGGVLKYEAVVEAGADPASLRMTYDGVSGLGIDAASGALLVRTAAGELEEGAPRTYQAVGGTEEEVASAFELQGGRTVGFALGPYHEELPLIIDPGFPFATYLGGSNDDGCMGIDVDSEGNTYILGSTNSADFPSGPSGYDQTLSGPSDVLVAKLNSNGTALLWSTFIGSSGQDGVWGKGIDIDGEGNVYIAGNTFSADFPTTSGAYNRTPSDAFVLKLDPTGTRLVYSTFIGGSGGTWPLHLQVDASGNAYVAGRTDALDLPTTPGAFQRVHHGRYNKDVFVLKLNAAGSGLLYSTYLGFDDDDEPTDLYVDALGCAFVTGTTGSSYFPTTSGAYDTTFNGGLSDVFVTKLNAAGSGLVYSTLIGTEDSEDGGALFPGPGGSMWSVASIGSAFPTTPDAFDRTHNGYADINLFRLSAAGSAIEYSTVIGGSDSDEPVDLAIDEAGDFCILGTTYSTDFPLSELAFSKEITDPAGEGDCFFMRLDPALSRIVYSTYFGGNWMEFPKALVIGPDGFAHAGGSFYGLDFPTSMGSYDTTAGPGESSWEGFVVKLDAEDPVLARTLHDPFATTGDTFNVSVEASDNHVVEGVSVEWWSGASPEHAWENFSLVSGTPLDGRWNASLLAPAHSLDPIHFRVRMRDQMGNFIVGPELSVPVYDNDPPTFTDASRGPATTGDLLTLAVDVVDNIGVNVSGALVRYWYGDSTAGATVAVMRPASITPVRNGTYDLVVRVPSNSTEALHYVFLANDTSGNEGASEVFTLLVYDNDAPVIVSEDVPDPATTGDPFKVTVRLEDNIGMAMAKVTFWFGPSGTQVTRNMRALDVDGQRNGLYDHTVDVPSDSLLSLYILLTASDAANNVCFGTVVSVRVVDNDAPSLAPEPPSPPPETGGVTRLLVHVGENIGVQGVSASYAFDDLDEVRADLDPQGADARGAGLYAISIDVPASALVLRYRFEASDTQGNANATGTLANDVLDVIAPTIAFLFDADETLLKGLDRTFSAVIEDNVGVLGAYMECLMAGGAGGENLTMVGAPDGTFTATVRVPRAYDGTLRVLFRARDAAGNWNSTGLFEYPTANAAPVVRPLPGWQVVEGTEGAFDLGPYVSDANDPAGDLTVTCDLAAVRVEGLVLRLNLSAWQSDRALVLRVSDGEDAATALLALHVVNVNDAPVIGRVLPESGARFRKGSEVRFLANATDEDGDQLAYRWKEGARALGTGDSLGVKGLRPGRHTVTIEVSDGNATASGQLVVVIEGDKEFGSALLLLLLIVILAVVALLLVLRRRRAAASRRDGPG